MGWGWWVGLVSWCDGRVVRWFDGVGLVAAMTFKNRK